MNSSEVTNNVENDNPRKLSENILDSFRKLTYNLEKQRIDGGTSLLKYLLSKQKNCNGTQNTERDYAIQRLVRGLGSSKIEARNGFFSTLVAFLMHFPEVSHEHIKKAVNKELMIAKNQSKAEQADIYTGQILAHGVLIRSGKFNEMPVKTQLESIKDLIETAKNKSYLPLASYIFVVELINKMELAEFKQGVWPVLESYICIEWSEHSLETIYCLLKISSKFPKLLKKHKLIFNEKSLPFIAKLIFTFSNVNHLKNHPVLEEIATKIGQSSELVKDFWADNCVGTYLTETNRHHDILTLTLWNFCIKHLANHSWIVYMLQPNVVKFILRERSFKNNKSTLLSALGDKLDIPEVNEETLLQVFQKLVRDLPGTPSIEKTTGIRILPKLTARLHETGVKQLGEWYKELIIDKERKIYERIAASNHFTKVLSHNALKNNIDWCSENILWLFENAFTRDKDKPEVLKKELKEGLFRIIGQHSKANLLYKLHTKVIKKINEYIELKKTPELINKEYRKEWDHTYETLNQLASIINSENFKENSNASCALHFHMLLSQLALYLFYDGNLAMEALQELHNCIDHSQVLGKENQNDSKDSDALHWTEVVTDLLLSLLSKDNATLRNLVNNAFKYLCHQISPEAARSLIEALNPSFENDDHESDESDNESNEEAKNGHDLSESENEENEENDNESDIDSEKENQEDDDDELVEDEEEPVMEEFRMAVQNALKSNGNESDADSIDMDEVLDEEQAKKLDDALSAAFKAFRPVSASRKKSNLKPTKDQIAMTHFRIRVLDLINIYLDNEPNLRWCLELIQPLLELYEVSVTKGKIRDQPLEARISTIFKHLGSLNSCSEQNANVTNEELIDLLNTILLASRTSTLNEEITSQIQNVINFLLLVSTKFVKQKKKQTQDLGSNLVKILDNHFNKRGEGSFPDKLYWWMIKNRRWPELVFQVVKNLAKHAFNTSENSNLRPYRRSLALQMIGTAFLNNTFLKNTEDYHEFEQWLWSKTKEILNGDQTTIITELANLFHIIGKHQKDSEIDWISIEDTWSAYLNNAQDLSNKQAASIKKLINFLRQINSAKRNLNISNNKSAKKVKKQRLSQEFDNESPPKKIKRKN